MLLNKDERKTIETAQLAYISNALSRDEFRAILAHFRLIAPKATEVAEEPTTPQPEDPATPAPKWHVGDRFRWERSPDYPIGHITAIKESIHDPNGHAAMVDWGVQVPSGINSSGNWFTLDGKSCKFPCTKLPAEATPSTPQRRFEIGDRVIHEQWGEGVIRRYYKAYDADTAPWQVKFEDGHHWCVEERLEPVKQPTTGATVDLTPAPLAIGDSVRDNDGDCGIIKAIADGDAWVRFDDYRPGHDDWICSLDELTRL